ncbi:hypothetical protein LguiB_018072 [Lonicera macranthoides]
MGLNEFNYDESANSAIEKLHRSIVDGKQMNESSMDNYRHLGSSEVSNFVSVPPKGGTCKIVGKCE